MNTQQLKDVAQRVKYCDFSVNDSGYGVISYEGTFADCLGMDEASFIYAANPRVVLALIECLEAAERERDELRAEQAEHDKQIVTMEGKFNLAKRALDSKTERCDKAEAELLQWKESHGQVIESRDLYKSQFKKALREKLKAEAELARRDAAAREPIAWQFYDDGSWHNGSNHNNHRENTEKAGYRIRELFTAAPPAVLPPAGDEYSQDQWWYKKLLEVLPGSDLDLRRAIVCVIPRMIVELNARGSSSSVVLTPDVIPQAEHIASVLEMIGSFDADDIDSDSVDLRFEVDGVDTGSDASITEYATKGAGIIRSLVMGAQPQKIVDMRHIGHATVQVSGQRYPYLDKVDVLHVLKEMGIRIRTKDSDPAEGVEVTL